MASEDYLIKELSTEIKVIKARVRLSEEVLFWLSIAQIYLDTRTMYGILECDKIVEMCRKMRLE